ncbi:uncharacterized protein Z520_06192 [Fonsecaea multimorphosa CBS 102226]|uniref:Uncharacterized protein n=1 Tax=Fonsecaea multimorphosa CBS 102226 TaxID=1442371 RepID=A0A0D2JX12_9EURO|nr:uncharacterized protein Z520_06192 [Fonsecaea multimorphosa CBS 102226]KIX98112.1 hypothetical protein Z520_06192 [Fonsecaea multimorphosa CBS 102226]
MPTANQLRRDAAFRGSSVEMLIANTTSLYVSLNNLNSASKQQQPERLDAREIYHSELRSINARASDPVSLVVSIEGHNTYWVEAAGLVVPIVQDLDPREMYRVRLTHMGGPNSTNGILEFEGLWLGKATSAYASAASSTSNKISSPARLLPFGEGLDRLSNNEADTPQRGRKVVEIVTSEVSVLAMNHLHPALQNNSNDRVDDWYKELDTVILDTTGIGLLPTQESGLSVRDQFFRAGPPGTKAFARPWNFKLYSPSVLLLQLGLEDFVAFFSSATKGKPVVNKHALAKYTNEFVNAYVKLIQAIRANAYPFNPEATPTTTHLDEDDGSYIYNSAPSTLTIFLLTPFSAARHSVTKKLKLDRVISSALAQVVSTVQAEGDKSTFWIDTTGWLDAETDFESSRPSSNSPEQSPPLSPPSSASFVLNSAGISKVATVLADHLCPYIGPSPNSHGSSPEGATPARPSPCPFDRYDNYLGNVYLPTDVDFDRTLLEHKIELIKQKFNL